MTTTAPLSTLLRTGTQDEHAAAEGSLFVEDLLEGRLSAAAYADLAVQLLPVYRALEAVGDELSSDPLAGRLIFEELRRAPSLEADIIALVGTEAATLTSPEPAASAYAERIAAGRTLPRYLAHAYTRYLGDLSGGQVIARMVQRHYGVPDSALAFYTFTAIPKPKPFKDEFRSRMDALPLTAEQRDEVVDEARAAFRANRELFSILGERHRA